MQKITKNTNTSILSMCQTICIPIIVGVTLGAALDFSFAMCVFPEFFKVLNEQFIIILKL